MARKTGRFMVASLRVRLIMAVYWLMASELESSEELP